MKKLKLLAVIFYTFNPLIGFSQFKSNNIGGYTFSLQVDSSHFFIVGGQPNKAEKTKYVTEDRSHGFTSYSGEVTLWTNAYVYNDSTEKLVRLFNLPLIGVYPVINTIAMLKYDYYNQRTITSGTAKNHIVFVVKTDGYNNDGVMDSDDPVYLFISSKDGTGCRQITPNGMNVTNWRLTKAGMGILFTSQVDKNSDKKFTEDEELYQIDLDADISKIKIKPVTVEL